MQEELNFCSDKKGNQFFLDLARCIHESDSMQMALQQLLSLLTTMDKWQVILLWEWKSNENNLQCIEAFSEPDAKLEAFKHATKNLKASYDTLITPFHALKNKKSMFVTDMQEDPRFEIASQAGIEGGIVIPIFVNSHASYVLEIYKKGSLDVEKHALPLQVLVDWMRLQCEAFIQNLLTKKAFQSQKEVLDAMVDAVYSCDLQGNIQTWSKGCELIYKWEEEEILGKSIKTLIPDQEEDFFEVLLQNFSQGKPLLHIERNAVTKEGEIFVIHTTYTMIRNAEHAVVGVAISAHNATCQAREREAIEQREKKYKDVVENIQEWIYEIDHNLRIRYSNHSVEKILGLKIEDVEGRDIASLLVEEDDLKLFKEKKSWENKVLQMKGKDQQIYHIECSGVPFQSNNYANHVGFRIAARDISDKVHLQKMKDEFLSITSHELRTPLASIIAALDLLKDQEMLKEESLEIVQIIEKNSQILKELIDNIITVEKLQSNELSLVKERISLKSLVENSIESNKTLADKKHIRLCFEIEDVFINADFGQLCQVLNNFLSNAIKFSPEHSTIRLYTTIQGQRVCLSVSDEGRGISEEFKPRIFQKFAQEDAFEKHTHDGTGLGLYICKEIIQKLGGEIGFTSKSAKGSTFYFEFPLY